MVTLNMELDTLDKLLLHALRRRAVRRIERVVKAKGTATARNRAIAIRTGKASVDSELLHPLAKKVFEVTGIGIEATPIAPRVKQLCHLSEIKRWTKIEKKP